MLTTVSPNRVKISLKNKLKKELEQIKKTPIPQLYKEELTKFTSKQHPHFEQTEENASSIKSLKSYAKSLQTNLVKPSIYNPSYLTSVAKIRERLPYNTLYM